MNAKDLMKNTENMVADSIAVDVLYIKRYPA